VDDLDNATERFTSILHSRESDETTARDEAVAGAFETRPVSLAGAKLTFLPDSTDHEPSLIAVYDTIVNHWLTPLSSRVPGRVRLAKEQLARQIAAEVCLASCGLRSPVAPDSQDETMLDVDDAHQMQLISSPLPQSSFPTPSPTATPSLTTATSLSSHPSTMASPEYMRLQKYAKFSSERTVPAPLSKVLSHKLAHWSLGGNPHEYDWLAVQRQQQKEAEEESADLTVRERARIKRRAEKHLEKQRRETQKAKTMELASSQAPEILSASQPASLLHKRVRPTSFGMPGIASQAALMSSPQATQSPSRHLAASQAMPGKFGGRPAPKKKQRLDGF